jgi:hypothetical protein
MDDVIAFCGGGLIAGKGQLYMGLHICSTWYLGESGAIGYNCGMKLAKIHRLGALDGR